MVAGVATIDGVVAVGDQQRKHENQKQTQGKGTLGFLHKLKPPNKYFCSKTALSDDRISHFFHFVKKNSCFL